MKLIKENQFMSLLLFFCLFTYRFVNSAVTVIPLILYYYQLYKIPNKKQTDFQNLSHQKFTLYTCFIVNFEHMSYLTYLIYFIVNFERLNASWDPASQNIFDDSFYDLLLLLRTDYSVTMTSHQGKKKMTCVVFLLYLYFTEHRKKQDVVLLYIFAFHSIDSKILTKLTTCK